MRQVLDNSAHETITLADEMQFVKACLQAESMRLEQNLAYIIKVHEAVDAFATLIPGMVLQPFLENSI
jgi:sensor histidine kinase YesM